MTISLKPPIEEFCNVISNEPELNSFITSFSTLKRDASYQDDGLGKQVEDALTGFMIEIKQLRKAGFGAFFGWEGKNKVADKGEEALKKFANTLKKNILLSPLEPVHPHAYLWAAGCYVGMDVIWQNKKPDNKLMERVKQRNVSADLRQNLV